MIVTIRQETSADFKAVFDLTEKAFRSDKYGDHTEQFLVERLRRSTSFIPELSLVAVLDDVVVGHIILTKATIENSKASFKTLALGPVSVLPEYQGNGIGGKLISTAHDIAKTLGYGSIVLLGHENYYPRFGYQQADKLGIEFPFGAPKKNCMVVELKKNALEGVSGLVNYPAEFFM